MSYILTSEINAADTCRDEDDITVDRLGIFPSVQDAKQYMEDKLKQTGYYWRDLQWWEDKEGNHVGTQGGSYAPFYYIKEIK